MRLLLTSHAWDRNYDVPAQQAPAIVPSAISPSAQQSWAGGAASQRQPHANLTRVALYLLDFSMDNESRTKARTNAVQTLILTVHYRTTAHGKYRQNGTGGGGEG